MRTVPLIISICLLIASSAGQQPAPPNLDTAYKRIDEYVARQMKAQQIPGLALALTDRNGLMRVSTYGYADVKAKAPVTPETSFEIGSISKSFTAISLLQLREQGICESGLNPVDGYFNGLIARKAA